MNPIFDILGIGALAVDDLHHVPSYPREDGKVRVMARQREFGGLTGRALITAARLGARCSCAGVLGDDDESRFVREALSAEGIDIGAMAFDPVARPAHGTIIISEESGKRTVLSQSADPGAGRIGALPGASVMLIDHHLPATLLPVVEAMRAQGTQVVVDLERIHASTPAIEAVADHLIVPWSYARERTGAPDQASATLALWSSQRRMVAVTDGELGCWYTADGEVGHLGSIRIDAVDTNGCGDVFHGAYAWSLLEPRRLRERLRLASAAAAVKASARGLAHLRGSDQLQALIAAADRPANPTATTAPVMARG